jgi:hypothetical protein
MVLPSLGLATYRDPAWWHAVKPLTDDVTFTQVRGITATTGLLPT